MLGKTEGRRRREKMRWLGGISDSVDMNLEKLWKVVTESEAWSAAVHGATKSQTQLGDGTNQCPCKYRVSTQCISKALLSILKTAEGNVVLWGISAA